jgi:hypothetical protein
MAGIALGLIGSFPTPVTSSFESIVSAAGTGSSGTITFSSIPSTYKSLQIRGIARTTPLSNLVNFNIRFNGDTATNYTRHALIGDGAIVEALSQTAQNSIFVYEAGRGANAAANIVGVSIIDIHDYSSTTKYKTVRIIGGSDANDTSGDVALASGLWLSTAAIDSISIVTTSGSWTTQTQFALYGIKG